MTPGASLAQNALQLTDVKEAARRNAVDVQSCREKLQELTAKHEEHEQQAVQLAAARQKLLRQQFQTDSQSSDSSWQEAIKQHAHLTQSDADLSELRSSLGSGLQGLTKVTIAGAAGSGKSGFVRDWLRSVDHRGAAQAIETSAFTSAL